MRTSRPLPLLILLLLLASVVAGCGSDGDGGADQSRDARTSTTEGEPAPDADETFRLQVQDGQVIGGPQSMKAKAGDAVRLEILSDAADAAHVHGIDESVKVPEGSPAVIEFTVEDPGSYEVEFHDSGLVLGAVVVS